MSTLRDDEITTSPDETFEPKVSAELDTDADDADADDSDQGDSRLDGRCRHSRPGHRAGGLRRLARQARSRAASSPSRVETFLDDHWERLPLVVDRGGRSGFDDLLSVRGRRAARHVRRAPPPRVPPREGGRAAAPARLLDRHLLAARAVHRRRGRGARSRPRSRTARRSSSRGSTTGGRRSPCSAASSRRELGHPDAGERVLDAARLPGAAGAPRHARRVRASRSPGEKRWLVYEPVLELPLRDQRYRLELGEPGEPVHDVVLRAGDTIYLPRGWLHQAMTSQTDSLHLTVGVNVFTWIEALRAALKACADDVEFRRSVPRGRRGRARAARGARRAARARTPSPAGCARPLRRRPPPDPRRPLAQLRALDEIDAGTRGRAAPDRDRALRRGRRHVAARVRGQDARASRARARRGRASDLSRRRADRDRATCPGSLDDEGRLVLVRRLVREGFLVLSDV